MTSFIIVVFLNIGWDLKPGPCRRLLRRLYAGPPGTNLSLDDWLDEEDMMLFYTVKIVPKIQSWLGRVPL